MQIGSGAVLSEALASRISKNRSYSLRAFARDLGLSPGFLSKVLSGKKALSRERAVRVSSALGLSDIQTEGLLRPGVPKKDRAPASTLALDQLRAFSQWYHVAILDLATCRNFKPDAVWIAKRLKISSAQARDAVARLLRLRLLKESKNTWVKTNQSLELPTKKSEPEVRAFHRQMIGKALDALDEPSIGAFQRRDIRGITMAVNPKKIPEAKLLIARFQQELADLLATGECTEVYQFNSQLFGLSYPVNERKGDL